MNSVGIKYKSLLTSVFIHFFIALLLTAVYKQYQEKKCETRVCVNLKALHNVEPKPLKKEQKKSITKPIVKKIPLAKPVVKKKIVPIVKKKSVPVKKLVVEPEAFVVKKEVELKPVEIQEIQKVAVVEEEEVQKVVEAKSILVEPQERIPVVHLSPEQEYMDENLAIINALIKRHLSYPRLAKKRGLQGKALVKFTIDKEGEIIEIAASGQLASLLKKSALKTVQKASLSFPHPSEVLTLQIPIVYKLH